MLKLNAQAKRPTRHMPWWLWESDSNDWLTHAVLALKYSVIVTNVILDHWRRSTLHCISYSAYIGWPTNVISTTNSEYQRLHQECYITISSLSSLKKNKINYEVAIFCIQHSNVSDDFNAINRRPTWMILIHAHVINVYIYNPLISLYEWYNTFIKMDETLKTNPIKNLCTSTIKHNQFRCPLPER